MLQLPTAKMLAARLKASPVLHCKLASDARHERKSRAQAQAQCSLQCCRALQQPASTGTVRTLLTSDSSSVCPASAHLLVPRRRTSAPGAEGPPHSGDSSRKARPPELLLLVVPASSWHGKSIHGQSRTQLTSSFASPPSPRCTDAGLQRPGLGLRFSNLPRKKVLQSLVFFLMMRQSPPRRMSLLRLLTCKRRQGASQQD